MMKFLWKRNKEFTFIHSCWMFTQVCTVEISLQQHVYSCFNGQLSVAFSFFVSCVHLLSIKRVVVQRALSCTGIHKFKSRLPPRDPKSIRAQPYDPIPPVAEQISSQWWLLCFDEFQVTS